jgi:hypothetical protein
MTTHEATGAIPRSPLPATARRYAAMAAMVVVALIGSLLSGTTPAWASETPKGTYTDVAMGSDGHYNQDFFIFPNTEATNYFWADYFGFNSPVNRHGYMGLQRLGTGGKIALATIFGTGTTGTAGAPLQTEGPGWTIRIPFNWQINHYYRIRIWKNSGPTTWGFWAAEVDSTLTRVITETYLGNITASGASSLNRMSTMFTEYFGGALSTCSALPYSGAYLQLRDDGGTVIAAVRNNYLGTGSCTNSRVAFYAEWSHHEMGV